jgi:hypothetical protein
MTTLTILPHTESDLAIPPVAAILDRVDDLADDAWRHDDNATYRQLVHLRDALKRGMQMAWSLGDLLVTSASSAGVVYTVSCGACNCPAYKPCKHLKLAEVLLDMLDTAAGDADLEADVDQWEFAAAMSDYDQPNEPSPLGDEPGDTLPTARALGARLAMTRSAYAYC